MTTMIITTNDTTLAADTQHENLEQPKMFRGTLKGYQLKGISWLVNLYNQVCSVTRDVI